MISAPSHWRNDRLKDVAGINVTTLPADTDPAYEFKYLEISNVNYHGVINPNAIERVRYEDAPSRARRRLSNNSIVISSVRPNLQAIAFVPDAGDALICSTGFNVVDTDQARIDPKFAYYILISENARQYFESVATGVGYPAVGDKDFSSLPLPIPPLPEQRSIVAFLDASCMAIDAALAAKARQIEMLEALRLARITQLVTGGLTPVGPLRQSTVAWLQNAPSHWRIERLKDVVIAFVDYRGKTPEKTPSGIPLVTARNIKNGRIDFSESREYISADDYDDWMVRGFPERGDVLITTEAPMGRSP